MSKFRVLKNSFLGGQVSRDAVGRTDLPQYPHSCEILQNMIPLLSGGAYRRPGTLYQSFIPGSSDTPAPDGSLGGPASGPPRLFPFVVSNYQAFAILLSCNRFGHSPDSAFAGGGYMTYFQATGNSPDSLFTNAQYLCHPYRGKSVAVAASGTDEALWTRQGGPAAVANTGTFSSDYASATILDVADSLQTFDDDIWAVQYCQANDVMFLTHPDYPPYVISLNSDGNPVISPWASDTGQTLLEDGLSFAQSRPYINMNSTAVTMAVTYSGDSPISGSLTCSVPFFNALHAPRSEQFFGDDGGSAGRDGAIFGLAVGTGGASGDNQMFFVIVTSVSSSTVAAVDFITPPPGSYSSATAMTEWYESAWSNYRGWPRACAVYQQRLVMAGTIHQPSSLWFTATAAFGVAGGSTWPKFSALGDGPSQGIVAGATGVLANGQNYTTPQNWVYYPVDDSQGDGQSTGPLGSQPFRLSLATTTLDAIQYLSPDQQLFVGTGTQEWIIAIENGSFDVANSTCTVQSHYGSDLVQAVRIGYELMFVHQKKDEVRAYQYNYFDQSFFGEPVQLFFDEYPVDEEGTGGTETNPYAGRKKFRTIDWDASRSTLWCIDTAGSLFGLTRDRKLQVTAWHTHQLGGFNAANGVGNEIGYNLSASNLYTDSAYFQCDGSVISAISAPNPLSGVRDIWMVVKRSFQNGTGNIWSVERMVGANTVRQSAYSVVAPGNAQEPCYVDCAQFLDDDDATIFNYSVGAQLVGATLTGTYYSAAWGMFVLGTTGPVTGTSTGTLPLDPNTVAPDYGTSAVHSIVVGYPYTSIIQPVRFDMPSQVGTGQGAIKRISKVYARVFKTLMFKLGVPPKDGFAAALETVRFKPSPTSMAQSPEIYTGDKQIFVPAQFDRDGYLYILQDQPLPFTLVSLSVEGVEYEQ